jgi:hypothetical protein
MSENERTQAQIEADANLTQAIDQCLRAYEFEEDFILTDYMVIVAQSRIDSAGDTATAYASLYRDSEMPYHRILGLLEIARTRARFNMNQEE